MSARTFLLLSAVGGLSLAAAPAIALFQLLKPEKDHDWLVKRKALIDYLFIKLENSKLIRKLEETRESLEDIVSSGLDLGDYESWKKEHDRLYGRKPDK